MGMFVALSKFVIANEMEGAIKEAFQGRPHKVDGAAGFIRLEVLSPEDQPKEIWLLTYWDDRRSFEEWHKSHLYRESHSGIPKGLKLVPGSAKLQYFTHVAS
jgi:heme oxygenase (mycobilin-producing)